MNFITIIKRMNSRIVDEKLNYLVVIIFFSLATGIIISFGIFTFPQMLILIAAVFVLFFIFNKPDIICFIAVILMFIPLSLGTIFKLRLTWSAEPIIMILFFLIVLRNVNFEEKSSVLAAKENPFLVVLLLYSAIFIFNYVRYPLPASSIAGVAEEMGGVRFYYEKILIFLFCLSIGYLVEMYNTFSKRFLNLLLWMVTFVTALGVLILLFEPLYEFIERLRDSGVFTTSSILTGLWFKGIDPFTGALRNTVLWITPFGILILMANVVNVRKMLKVFLLIFFIIGLILSATRNFFFGTLLALIVWALLTRNKKLLIVLVFITIIAFLLPGMGLLSRQFGRILYFPSDLDKLTSFRYELFKVYWSTFKQNPLFGVGVGATEIGNSSPGSPEYFILQNLRYGGHGFFLGTLYTQGVVGLMPFLLLYVMTIKHGLRIFRLQHTIHYRNIGLFSIIFVAYSFIPFLIGGSETYNQFFIIIGVLAGLVAREHKLHEARK